MGDARTAPEVKEESKVGPSKTPLDSMILGNSDAVRAVLFLINRIADSDASVLITGESGTGKELTAQAIHGSSKRRGKPFVPINLPAIPHSLIESELFGHQRGAFTDAHESKLGLFQQADGGTIFLDEIGELAPDLQAKLLRVLQEQEIRPLGSTETKSVDVRVIAATNRDLEKMLGTGEFREDLYYRLNVIDLRLPPLRERPSDILLLANHFLNNAARDSKPSKLSAEAESTLLSYEWPGNIRELQNVVERGLAFAEGSTVELADLPSQVRTKPSADFLSRAVALRMTLSELEQSYIERVLKDEGGNKTRAALRLGLDRKTLYRKLEEYARSQGRKKSPAVYTLRTKSPPKPSGQSNK